MFHLGLESCLSDPSVFHHTKQSLTAPGNFDKGRLMSLFTLAFREFRNHSQALSEVRQEAPRTAWEIKLRYAFLYYI